MASSCGVQQGDPLGRLLFSLAVRHVSHPGSAALRLCYLDDTTICGMVNDLTVEIIRICDSSSELGLILNELKWEVITDEQSYLECVCSVLPGCKHVNTVEATLLWAPLGALSLSISLQKRVKDLLSLQKRLALVRIMTLSRSPGVCSVTLELFRNCVLVQRSVNNIQLRNTTRHC